MSKKSFAERVMSAQVMTAGVSQNLALLATVGITEATAEELKTLGNEVVVLNDEQETLKAHLKMKTEELDKKMQELDELVARCRKLVKLEIPKAQWREFGIEVQS